MQNKLYSSLFNEAKQPLHSMSQRVLGGTLSSPGKGQLVKKQACSIFSFMSDSVLVGCFVFLRNE